jgi:long-subunit acyl-CoA synthetase (AMP-forming)
MVPAPMYHTNGFATFLMLLAGDHLVILEKFDAALVLDVIERYRVTNFTATPTMLARIAARPDVRQRDLSSVVFILQGAAVMPPALLHTWFELLSPEQILTAYGMTENLGLTALRGDEWLTHPGSVGRGFRDTEIRILDADKNPLGPGEDGDVYLRAPMSVGYRYLGGAPPLPSTEDGFRSAGDIGHLDADGFLSITDRKKELLKTSGGKLIAPQPIENKLKAHALVGQAALVGDKHKFAAVLISPNFAALEAWAHAHGVANSNRAALVEHPKVIAHYQHIVDQVNATLANFEDIKRLRVVPDEWSIETEELTPSMKLKRRVVEKKYAAFIAAFYHDEATSTR